MKLRVTVNQIEYTVEIEVDNTPTSLPPLIVGAGPAVGPAAGPAAVKAHVVAAPLAGAVRRFLVEPGQEVRVGDVVALLEAMKMETEITTPVAGKVSRIVAEIGVAVLSGDPILEITPAA